MHVMDHLGDFKDQMCNAWVPVNHLFEESEQRTSKALTHKMTLTVMMHFLSFSSSWVYVTSCLTDHYFFLFWWKRSIQNWAIFLVFKSATIIFKFITLTVKKWKFALYIKKEMSLLCNEDDSLVANVFYVCTQT